MSKATRRVSPRPRDTRDTRRPGPPAATLRAIASALFAGLFVAGFALRGSAFDPVAGAIVSTQLFPAAARLLAGSAIAGSAAAIVVIALSALFGRVYCSTLCPLGAAQDAAAAAGHKGGRRPYAYARGRPLLRAAAFVAVAVGLSLGAGSYAAIVDPYSLSGRFVRYAARPAIQAVAGLASAAARAFGAYLRVAPDAFDPKAALVATVPVLLVLGAAFLRGRPFCDSLCPVGAVLGVLNRWAPLRVRLDDTKCVACGACEAVCKSRCIDSASKVLESDRCVSCFSCLQACPTGALGYGPGIKAGHSSRAARLARRQHRPAVRDGDESAGLDRRAGLSRRSFLKNTAIGGLAIAGLPSRSAAAAALGTPPSGTDVRSPLAPPASAARLAPAAPPGAVSLGRFLSRCTACGLCVARCPSGVLKPSWFRYGPRGLLAPFLDYDASYCQYECTSCLDVCPTGALDRMSLAEKKLVQMGTAALVRDKCIVVTEKTACGACAEHCPTGAVRMIAAPTGVPEPLFDEKICIGCGACHHICPAEPDKAITVTGKAEHARAAAPTKDLFSSGGDGAAGEAGPEEFPF
ncbi:MAG: 4Fe-4S dicluster domain-containing protein [Spirochaetes bacterium]|nr:4Fe-4S dicluster domain-containing protein [Spirochaetota bacterium]MBU1079763.1 4Fe-4S dicluster domain-containing protein [Spirochaetota bacterium]